MKQDKLTAAREFAGLTHEEVAKSVGISRSFYTQIEQGTRRPSISVLLRIANFFNVSVEDIFLTNKDASSNINRQTTALPRTG